VVNNINQRRKIFPKKPERSLDKFAASDSPGSRVPSGADLRTSWVNDQENVAALQEEFKMFQSAPKLFLRWTTVHPRWSESGLRPVMVSNPLRTARQTSRIHFASMFIGHNCITSAAHLPVPYLLSHIGAKQIIITPHQRNSLMSAAGRAKLFLGQHISLLNTFNGRLEIIDIRYICNRFHFRGSRLS
jgi:hypothetical protein